jgi:hypothetical protein
MGNPAYARVGPETRGRYPLRKSVFAVADASTAERIRQAAVAAGLKCEVHESETAGTQVTISHREYERDAAERVVLGVDATAERRTGLTG